MTVTLTSVERIQELCNRFPVLQGQEFIGNWNAVMLDKWAASVASSGERLAAQFVLHIWNTDENWKCGTFEFGRAYHTWDYTNWQAFATWVADPFTL